MKMGTSHSNDRNNFPFNIQVPSSLRDPKENTFSIDQLQRVGTLEDTRKLALECLHDDRVFAALWNSNQIHPQTRRWLRKLVQIQTINAVCNGLLSSFYRLPNGKRVQLDHELMAHAAQGSKQYGNQHKYDVSRQQRVYEQPVRILVVNGDCLDTVRSFKTKHPNSNPVVLNMANAHTPGGGWRDGCGAQEENLHRRSNLFQCLEDSYHQFFSTRDWSYPIPEFGGIYSPLVSVFRGSEAEGYPFFPNGPEYISFIACAAYAHPPIRMNKDREYELHGKDVIDNTMKKMDAILKIALENGHDTVILSAFGCGAFENPPKHIAKLFHELISQNYSHAFEYIIFAVIDDHNAMREHNPTGNIKPFAEMFKTTILSINEL